MNETDLNKEFIEKKMTPENQKVVDFVFSCVNNCEDRVMVTDDLLPKFHEFSEHDKGKIFCFLLGTIKKYKPEEKLK